MTDQTPVLMPVADTAPPAAGPLTDDGALRGGRCEQCAALSFPRAYICHQCNSTDIAAHEIPGRGSLYSFTTVHISPTFDTPYTLGYVDLEGGLRVLGQVFVPQDELACDTRVVAVTTPDSPTGWGFIPEPEEGR